MLIEKIMMPYILAEQHPVIHLTMLVVSILVKLTDSHVLIWDSTTCKKDTVYWLNTPYAAFWWLIANNVLNLVFGFVQKILSNRTNAVRRHRKND